MNLAFAALNLLWSIVLMVAAWRNHRCARVNAAAARANAEAAQINANRARFLEAKTRAIAAGYPPPHDVSN